MDNNNNTAQSANISQPVQTNSALPLVQNLTQEPVPTPVNVQPQITPNLPVKPMAVGAKRNILLIEDDPIILRMYSTKLKNSGYEVREAVDGQEAIEILNSFKPDVILLDLMLPKLDGFGFLQKAKPVLGNTPVIILTNFSQDTDKNKARELGAVDFLVKADITPQDVVNTIQKHI